MTVHPDVDLAHRQFILADQDLRFIRAQYREAPKPDSIRLTRLKAAMQVWEDRLRDWAQRVEANPDPESRRAWRDADCSRVPIPE